MLMMFTSRLRKLSGAAVSVINSGTRQCAGLSTVTAVSRETWLKAMANTCTTLRLMVQGYERRMDMMNTRVPKRLGATGSKMLRTLGARAWQRVSRATLR